MWPDTARHLSRPCSRHRIFADRQSSWLMLKWNPPEPLGCQAPGIYQLTWGREYVTMKIASAFPILLLLTNCFALGLELPSGGTADLGEIIPALDSTNASPPVITANPKSR